MFSKALIATDLSEACDEVVRCAKGLRNLGTTEVVLIQCFNIRDVGTLAPRLMELSRPALERQSALLTDAGFAVTSDMVLGLPQVEIGYQAAERGCSFIVVGSHGQTLSSEILLGSVASGVIHSAHLPVLVVRLHLSKVDGKVACHAGECDFLEHVLFPTDFSRNAGQAFRYVRELARRGARRITLLHVQDKARLSGRLEDRMDEFNRIDTERLTLLQQDLSALGTPEVTIELSYGAPKVEIIERSRRSGMSLVVMGRQGRGYVAGLFLGGVSYAVARHSPASVLIVP
jgi:nucleotide-binding universal stress UspA family protein